MKKYLSVAVALVAGIIAMAIILTKVPFQEVLQSFSGAPAWAILAYILIQIGIMITHAWRWQLVIRSQRGKAPYLWHLFWYRVIGYGVSYVTPTAKIGGEPVRAGLLTKHGMKFKDGLSTVVIDKTIELTTSGLFFIIGCLIILLGFGVPEDARIYMITATIIFSLLIFYFYYQVLNGNGFFRKFFRGMQLHRSKRGKRWDKSLLEFEKLIIKFYKHEKRYFSATILVSLLSWALMFLEFKILLIIVGYSQASVITVFLVIIFMGAAYMVPVPMALGVLEASQVSVFAIAGLVKAAGVALAFIVRLKDILWTVIGFIALSVYGLKLGETVRESEPVTKVVKRLHEDDNNNH